MDEQKTTFERVFAPVAGLHANVVGWLITVLVPIATGSLFGVVFNPLVGVVVFLLGIICLLIRALRQVEAELKTEWQSRRDDLAATKQSRLELTLSAEALDHLTDFNGATAHLRYYLWAEAKNLGPSSEFTARLDNMEGPVPYPGYKVDMPTWELNKKSRTTIEGNGGTRRIRIGAVCESPATFFFFTVLDDHSAGRGIVMPIPQGQAVEYRFDVEVRNTGDLDQLSTVRARLYIPTELDQVRFDSIDSGTDWLA